MSLLLPVTAQADDKKAPGSTRIAAADSVAGTLPFKLGMPLPRIDLDVDLKLLLVQNRPAATKNDAMDGEDTLLVALALAVPQSVDEDIAKQYGLELLERTELPELGLRIVQFRAPNNRATGPILAELRNDPRIRRAQHNAQYGVQPPGPPATAARRLDRPAPQAKLTPARPQPDRAAPVVAKVADRVGDVLSGGL